MIGVLALQGDFEAHVDALRRAGVAAREVRSADEILESEGLVETVRGRGTVVHAERTKRKISRRDLALRARDLAADAVLGGCTRRDVRALL